MPSSADKIDRPDMRVLLNQEEILRQTSKPLRPLKGQTKTVFDKQLRSFAVRISPAGVATFCMVYSFGGHARRYSIGRFRTEADAKRASGDRGLTARQARGEAVKLRTRIEAGEDIAAGRRSARAGEKQAEATKRAEKLERFTVAQSAELYLADLAQRATKLRPSTLISIEKSFRLHVLPILGDIEARQLSPDDVKRMHRAAAKLSKVGGRRTGGKIAANRATDYLSGMLTWLCDEGRLSANVARRNKERFHEEGRERYLSDQEWRDLELMLDRWPYVQSVPVGPRVKRRAMEERELGEPQLPLLLSCEAIRMFLLTGCRKGEALAARWEQFDLEAGVWTKPASSTKQKKLHRLELSTRMLERLRLIRSAHADPVFVFPGKDRLAVLQAGKIPRSGGHLTDVSGMWRTMRARLGIADVRLHDLRHSHASKLINSGVDLLTASKALGHSTVKTTEKYAHLQPGAVRAAANIVGDFSASTTAQTENRA